MIRLAIIFLFFMYSLIFISLIIYKSSFLSNNNIYVMFDITNNLKQQFVRLYKRI